MVPALTLACTETVTVPQTGIEPFQETVLGSGRHGAAAGDGRDQGQAGRQRVRKLGSRIVALRVRPVIAQHVGERHVVALEGIADAHAMDGDAGGDGTVALSVAVLFSGLGSVMPGGGVMVAVLVRVPHWGNWPSIW